MGRFMTNSLDGASPGASQSGADPFSRQFAGWNGDHEEDVRVVDREEDSGG
jgi:hypothetical protein